MFRRWWWVFLVLMPVGPVLGLLTAAVVTYVTPKMYESRAKIEVRPRMVYWDGVAQDSRDFSSFYISEADKIKSRNALKKVIDNLDLTRQWGVDRETALEMLLAMVSTKEIKGRDVISIRVMCADKAAARDIATEVVRCYRDYRDEVDAREVAMALEELKKAVVAQEKIVEERRKVLADLVRDKEIGGDQSDEPAKQDLASEQEMFQRMKTLTAKEEDRAKVPAGHVVVIDDPVIPQSPVSPNVALNLTVGTVLGLLLGLPLALLVVWLLERLVPRKAAR
ncbi:MAG: GNVR domain-containing protein [Verrucomicrobiota bacterium]